MKTFRTVGSGSTQTIEPIENNKIPVYETKTAAENDLANLEVGQIIATKDEGNELSNPVDVVQDGNMHAVTSNAVADSLSYSTDEVKTGGKWIDGKPIYRKVVSFGALPNAGEKSVTFDAVSDDTWVSITAIAKSTVSNAAICIPYADVSNINASINYHIMNNAIIVNAGTIGRSDYDSCYFILEYTKTTD